MLQYVLLLLSIVVLAVILTGGGYCALSLAHQAGLSDGISRLVHAGVDVLAIGSIVVVILARRDA
jgi:hypothetical protein